MVDRTSLEHRGLALREHDRRFDRFADELAVLARGPSVRKAPLDGLDVLNGLQSARDAKAVLGWVAIEVEDAFYRAVNDQWPDAPTYGAVIEAARPGCVVVVDAYGGG